MENFNLTIARVVLFFLFVAFVFVFTYFSAFNALIKDKSDEKTINKLIKKFNKMMMRRLIIMSILPIVFLFLGLCVPLFLPTEMITSWAQLYGLGSLIFTFPYVVFLYVHKFNPYKTRSDGSVYLPKFNIVYVGFMSFLSLGFWIYIATDMLIKFF